MSEKLTNCKMHFILSKSIDYKGIIPSIDDFELEVVSGKSGQKSITGFSINVENTTENHAEEIANKKAQIFTDILSVISGTAPSSRCTGKSIIYSSGRRTVSITLVLQYSIRNNADLNITQNRLNSILENTDTELLQKMRYVNRAIDAIANQNPASAIKELVLACNENPQGDLAKYKSLRNALSHESVFLRDIQNIRRDFGANYFEFTSENGFDYTLKQNLDNLDTVAHSFLEQVREQVKNRI